MKRILFSAVLLTLISTAVFATLPPGPAGMVWVYINDPGVSGHEGFAGYMSKYETTNAQYCQFLNAALDSCDITRSGNDAIGASGSNSGTDFVGQPYYDGDGLGLDYDNITKGGAARIHYDGGAFRVDPGFENHPITYVSWYGATAFCNYYGYRLPTEWEWQAVADYDGSFIYGCGTTITNNMANYFGSTHPYGTTVVDTFGTYGYGMCDIAGNVQEWTSSIRSKYVIRGGGWEGNSYYCNVSSYNQVNPNAANYGIGFRVCRSVWVPAENPPDPNILQLRPAGQLKLVDPAVTYIYPDKPTILLTHGWNPDYPFIRDEPGTTPKWVAQMGGHMLVKPWASNYNILWWDWISSATSLTPLGPSNKSQRQGNALADALVETFESNYNEPVHFIGHSLGTAVNRYAVDALDANGWDCDNRAHVTLLDAAEIFGLASPIPSHTVWIDNYITAFGDIHSEAANVILLQGTPLLPSFVDWAEFHSYSWQWYDLSVQTPDLSLMGNKWSFENGGLNGAPSRDMCYVQTSDPCQLDLANITWNEATTLMSARDTLLVGHGAYYTYEAVTNPIKLMGDVALDVTTHVVAAKLKEVVQGGLTASQQSNILNDASADSGASSSYMWIPIQVPQGKDLLSFEYKFSGTSGGDYMTASIGDKQIFAIEAKYVTDTNYVNTSYIDIAGYSGQSVELLIAFNCDDIPGGELDVNNFQFHSTTVKTDLNSDGLVDFRDFPLLANNWRATDCNELNAWCNKCDFDMSGSVDANDIGTFTNNWLRDAGDPNTW